MALFSGKKCLIVLGMHRSGTSALTGALTLAGFDIGKNIMPPADENPRGFFENLSLVSLNDQILAELLNFWSDTLFIPEGWWDSETFQSFKEKIKIILEDEYTGEKPLLIKDPRLCIVLPLYLAVFRQLGLEPVFLICVRNPFEVANSLIRRNNLSQEKALLLWMDYQLKAEFYSRNLPRLFISYAKFLENPYQAVDKVLHHFLPDFRKDEKVEQGIGRFLDPGLTHPVTAENQASLNYLPGIHDFFRIQENADLKDLDAGEIEAVDQIRETFTGTVRFFNGMPQDYRAMLTVTYENNETVSMTAPIVYGLNTISFETDPEKKVKGMILRPCNAKAGLRILEAEVWNAERQVIKIDLKTANYTTRNKDTQTFVYDTDLAKMTVDMPEPLSIQKIIFKIEYISFGIASSRKVINRLQGI